MDDVDEEKMSKRIGYDQRTLWKVVKLDAVLDIAHACTKGVDWKGSSKGSIYDRYNEAVTHDGEFGLSCTFDCARFAKLMDIMARTETRLNEERKTTIRTTIKSIGPGGVDNWNEGKADGHH